MTKENIVPKGKQLHFLFMSTIRICQIVKVRYSKMACLISDRQGILGKDYLRQQNGVIRKYKLYFLNRFFWLGSRFNFWPAFK